MPWLHLACVPDLPLLAAPGATVGQPKAAVSGPKGSPRAVSSCPEKVSARPLLAARIRAPRTAVDEQLGCPEPVARVQSGRIALLAR